MFLQPDQIEVRAILDNSIGLRDWIAWTIAALTLGLLALYTWKTHLMQRAVAKQAEQIVHQTSLSIMPAFVLQIAGGGSKASLQILNIGNGVGVNITIDGVDIIPVSDEEASFGPNLVFKRALFVAQGRWGTIDHEQYIGNELVHPVSVHAPQPLDLLNRLSEDGAGDNVYELSVRFQDIEGNRYVQKTSMGKGGCIPGPVKPAREQEV